MSTTTKPTDCAEAMAIAGQAFRGIAEALRARGHALEQLTIELLPTGHLGVFLATDKFPKKE